MTEVDEALEIINRISPPAKAPVAWPVHDSLNGVLQQDITALIDSPRQDNSAMDGYVFCRQDLDDGLRDFPVQGEIPPETDAPSPLTSRSCARIMTGAPIPEGGDFIVPVEMTEVIPGNNGKEAGGRAQEHIRVQEVPKNNAIRRKGEGFSKGDVLLKSGTVVRPYELGLMIEAGYTRCDLRPPLKIALQVTGSEVTFRTNSSGPVLQAIMNSWPGAEVTVYPVIEDHPEALQARLPELKEQADVIVTTGGISAGKYDYLFTTFTELGAEPLIRKINQKPGKPFTLSVWDDVMVCNLPGNPVSAVFTAELYARELVYRLHGLPPNPPADVILSREVANPGGKTLFLPVGLTSRDGVLEADPGSDPGMRSHLLQIFRRCRGYLRVPPKTHLQKGDRARCHLFSEGSLG